jgi:hypothetical protein
MFTYSLNIIRYVDYALNMYITVQLQKSPRQVEETGVRRLDGHAHSGRRFLDVTETSTPTVVKSCFVSKFTLI